MDIKEKILVYPGWDESKYYQSLYQSIPNVVYATYKGAFFTLYRNTKLHQAQVIHLHWMTAYFAIDEPWSIRFVLRYIFACFDILFLKLFTSVKIIYTAHNLYEHETKHHQIEKFTKKILGKILDGIFVLGPSAPQLVHQEFDFPLQKIFVSLHGDFNQFYPIPTNSIQEILASFSLPKDKKIYLFFGTDKDYKGLSHLIDSFKKWQTNQAILVIAGITQDKHLLQAQNHENIIVFNRFLSDEELAKLFKAVDWIVLPYQRILTSGSLLTVMGQQKAVIAPQLGTIPDYLDENGGVLYESNKKDSLLLSLEKSIGLDAQKLGLYNAKKANQYNWKDIATETYNNIKKLI